RAAALRSDDAGDVGALLLEEALVERHREWHAVRRRAVIADGDVFSLRHAERHEQPQQWQDRRDNPPGVTIAHFILLKSRCKKSGTRRIGEDGPGPVMRR